MAPRLFNPLRESLRELQRLSGIEEAAPKKSLLDTFDERWDQGVAPKAARGLVRAVKDELGVDLEIGIYDALEAILRQKDCPIRSAIRTSLEKIAAKKAGKLKVGDRVRVTDGELKGKEGQVIGIYSDGVTVDIEQSGDDYDNQGEFIFRDFDKRLKVIR